MSNINRQSFTYYEDKDFEAILEDIDGYLFIHVTVHSYNKHIKARMKDKWNEIRVWAEVQGYDGINCYTPNPKFVKLLGGECELLRTIESGDDTYEVLRWALK